MENNRPTESKIMNIGKRIKEARNRAGMSIEELAEAIKKGRTTVINYEGDKTAIPATVIKDIAKATGSRAAWIAFGDGESNLDEDLISLLEDIQDLADSEKEVIKSMLDGMILKAHADKRRR